MADIDNSEAIKKMMHFEIEGDTYFVQVQIRGKDVGGRDLIVKDFHIHSIEHLDKEYPDIKDLCRKYRARAYIRLNQRSTWDANIIAQIEALQQQIEINRVMRKHLRTGEKPTFPKVLSISKLYSSALGRNNTEASESRKWIVDVDPDMVDPSKPGFGSITEIADTLSNIIATKCGTKENPEPHEIARLPSKSGIHLVTTTFNMHAFTCAVGKPKQGDFVKPDANTNLFIPSNLFITE